MTRLFFLFLIALQLFSAAYSQQKAYDVVVYGATASGVMASVAASREGMKVLLVEPGKHVGGMVTGGLSHTDYGDRTVIGGLAMEFYKKVADHYTTHIFYWRGPEPHVGEKIMLDWLKASGVDLQFGKRVDKVVKEQGVINSVTFTDKTTAAAKVFIDAGYEGDLMARAGVSYTVGREGKKDYHEAWAGRQPVTFTSHQIDARLNPFNNDKEKKLLPLIHPHEMAEIGAGDKGVQSYCFRMIATDRPDNMLPWPKPKNYNPAFLNWSRDTTRPGRCRSADRVLAYAAQPEIGYQLLRRHLHQSARRVELAVSRGGLQTPRQPVAVAQGLHAGAGLFSVD
jgi:hypothetical protein